MRALILLIAGVFVAHGIHGQTWGRKSVAGIGFEFPDSSKSYSTQEGSAMTYLADKYFLSVTKLPDTSDMNPETSLELSRYYAATAATASIKLRGRMVDNRDSTIGDRHLYYTAIEQIMPDSAISLYEMIQYMPEDTLYAFTTQYITTDNDAVNARTRFFNSIEWDIAKAQSKYLLPAVLVAALLVFIVAFMGLRQKLREA